MSSPQTVKIVPIIDTTKSPPYKYKDLADKPTVHLFYELIHRLREDPAETYSICPDFLTELRLEIANAREAYDNR